LEIVFEFLPKISPEFSIHMAQDDEPVYSRDEIVKEVTSFYEFLIGLHIPESALKRPPPGGWPDITPKRYAFLKKDDRVIDLIRHLPFIYKEDHSEGYQIYPMCAAVDFNGPFVTETLEKSPHDLFNIEPMEEATTAPAYVLSFAAETSGGDGFWRFINTKTGAITLYDSCVGPGGKGTLKNEVSPLLVIEKRFEAKDQYRADNDADAVSPRKKAAMRAGEDTTHMEPKSSLKC